MRNEEEEINHCQGKKGCGNGKKRRNANALGFFAHCFAVKRLSVRRINGIHTENIHRNYYAEADIRKLLGKIKVDNKGKCVSDKLGKSAVVGKQRNDDRGGDYRGDKSDKYFKNSLKALVFTGKHQPKHIGDGVDRKAL